ncbi:uncharacterized protein LOC101731115 [Xenopus tropicalis]|uniref:Uncharacterized protein LOC101731115 n=1 Tax=Xenopus tropicalis TaxID=8364 RepID=A0A8J0T5Q2_XENTR|nr:uncharacterized protein LOC101731115 [Xenopus tropicalis]|eukprot:XP_017951336.1 PREDICTED: uncharacterized protein LOC101731115 [Xenopus tropicalis]
MRFQHFFIHFFILLFLFFIFTNSATVPTLLCLKCDKDFEKIKDEFIHLFDMKDVLGSSKLDFIKPAIKKIFTATFEVVIAKMEERRLDKIGISELAKEFRKTMKSIKDTKAKGTEFIKAIESNIQELKQKAEIIAQTFEQERSCPNLKGGFKCGVLEQKIIQCGTCKEQTLVCVGGSNEKKCDETVSNCLMCVCRAGVCHHRTTKQLCQPCTGYQKCLNEVLHCKDQDLRVAEGEDLKFDCNLKFLNLVDEKFEFVLEKREESGVSSTQTANKPNFLIAKAGKEVSGRYSCTAKAKDVMFPISRVDFTVKVVSPPEPEFLGSSVPSPAEKFKFKDIRLAKIMVITGTVTCLAITASIMTCICLLIRESHKEEEARAQKKQTVLEEVKISMDSEKSKPGTREKATQTDV